MNQKSSPRAHPPFEAFPSNLAVPSSLTVHRVSTSPRITERPSPHVIAWCVHPPCSTTTVADHGFPWHLSHLTQPQGLEPGQSPLHLHIVANMSMPDTPLGFSDIGSPMPWYCAFTSENRTETRPDAPTIPAQEPSSFPRPPGTPAFSTTEAVFHAQIPGFRSTFSRELSPLRRLVPAHSFEKIRSHTSTQPATLRKIQRQAAVSPRTKILNSLGPCFCSLCVPPASHRYPEGCLSSTELTTVSAPQGVWCPKGRSLLVRPGRSQIRTKRRIINRAESKEPRPLQSPAR